MVPALCGHTVNPGKQEPFRGFVSSPPYRHAGSPFKRCYWVSRNSEMRSPLPSLISTSLLPTAPYFQFCNEKQRFDI